MSEARDSDNDSTRAMREIESLRGVNRDLRAAVPADAPAPMMDDEIIAQFARDTGKIINSNGEVIGDVPGWVAPGQNAPVPMAQPQGQEAREMFGRKKDNLAGGVRAGARKIKGIDLEAGDVIIDNQRYALAQEEIASVADFALKVMARNLNEEIEQMAADYGVKPIQTAPPSPPSQEAKSEDVPPVQAGAVEGAVSEGPNA